MQKLQKAREKGAKSAVIGADLHAVAQFKTQPFRERLLWIFSNLKVDIFGTNLCSKMHSIYTLTSTAGQWRPWLLLIGRLRLRSDGQIGQGTVVTSLWRGLGQRMTGRARDVSGQRSRTDHFARVRRSFAQIGRGYWRRRNVHRLNAERAAHSLAERRFDDAIIASGTQRRTVESRAALLRSAIGRTQRRRSIRTVLTVTR